VKIGFLENLGFTETEKPTPAYADIPHMKKQASKKNDSLSGGLKLRPKDLKYWDSANKIVTRCNCLFDLP
jgi:hypothetical protein